MPRASAAIPSEQRSPSEHTRFSATLRCTAWVGSAVLRVRRAWLVLASGALASFASFASAAPHLPVASVQSLFFIAKSENKNQVHYAVVVDAACKPKGDHPVYGYWREREVSPTAVSRLLDHEQRAYGLSEPRYVRQTPTGGQIRIALRGFPERPLIIETFRAGGSCGARTYATIRGETALLTSIYVDLGFLFSVNYAMLQGVRVADGQRVQEKIHD